MPIRVICPHCAAAYPVHRKHRGKQIRCKQCRQRIDVPEHAPLAVSESGVRRAKKAPPAESAFDGLQPPADEVRRPVRVGRRGNPALVLVVVLLGLLLVGTAVAIPVTVILLSQTKDTGPKGEPGDQLAADVGASRKEPEREQPKPPDRQAVKPQPTQPDKPPAPGAPAPAGQAYALKIKMYPDEGRSVVVREVNNQSGQSKYFDAAGKLVREDPPEEIREEKYTVTVLERAPGARLPRKFRRAYEKAAVRSGDTTTPLSHEGRSILFEMHNGRYLATAEGQPPLLGDDLARLAERAAPAFTNAILPGRPVKVGESWTIDPAALGDLPGKAAVVDSARAEGKLVRIYDKDGKPFGVLELTVHRSLKALGGLTFNPPGVQEKTCRLDAAIDGSGTAGLLTSVSRLTGTASLDEMGKKLSAEVAWTPSSRLECSAEGDAPAGPPPPATHMNDAWEFFVSPEGGFSARFPVKPKHETKKEPDGSTTHTVSALAPDLTNFAVTCIVSSRPGAFKAKEVLDAWAAKHAKITKDKRSVELSGHPGLELVLEEQRDGVWVAAVVRTYVVKDRLYTVEAVAHRDRKDPERFKQFFDSFALLDQNVTAKPPDPMKPANPPKPPDPVKPMAGAGLTLPELRDATMIWLRDNNFQGPANPFLKDLKTLLEQRVDEKKGFVIRVRPHILKSRKPTILCGWDGNFSVHELPPELLPALGFSPKDVELQTAPYGDQLRKAWQFTLSGLKLDPLSSVNTAQKITGSVACKRLAAGDGNFALRLTLISPGGELARGFLPITPPIGKDGVNVPFTFRDLASSLPEKVAGLMVVFAELVSYPDEERQGTPTVLSNAAVALSRVVPPKEEKK
jgi:hypothetical protein